VLEPKKSARNGAAVTTECRDDFLGCEVVLTSLKKSLDVLCDSSHRLPFVRSTYHNVSASANNRQVSRQELMPGEKTPPFWHD